MEIDSDFPERSISARIVATIDRTNTSIEPKQVTGGQRLDVLGKRGGEPRVAVAHACRDVAQ